MKLDESLSAMFRKLKKAGNGMLNTFQFVGPLVALDYSKGAFSIGLHPTDNRRAVEMRLGSLSIPRSIRLGQQICVNGYVRAAQVDGLRQLVFRPIAIRDCLDLSHFNPVAQAQWSSAVDSLSDSSPFRVDTVTFQAIRGAFPGNAYVGLQGFIDASYYEKGQVTEEGTVVTPPCLRLLIRQFENNDLSIPVRLYGRRQEAAAAIHSVIELSKRSEKNGRLLPIQLSGRVEVDIKDVPNPVLSHKGGLKRQDSATTSPQDERMSGEGEQPPVGTSDSDPPNLITQIQPIIKVGRLRMLRPEEYSYFMPRREQDPSTKETRVHDPYPWASVPIVGTRSVESAPEGNNEAAD